ARFLAALEETGRECCVARSGQGVHPVIGLWPIGLAGTLEAALVEGQRKASAWAEQQGAVEVFFHPAQLGGRAIDPFSTSTGVRISPRPMRCWQRNPSGVDASDLRAFQRQVIHQALLIENKADHRSPDLVGVDRAADPYCDDGYRTIDANLPSGPLIEPIQGIPGHEHDNDRTFLHAELKAERRGAV